MRSEPLHPACANREAWRPYEMQPAATKWVGLGPIGDDVLFHGVVSGSPGAFPVPIRRIDRRK